MIIAPHKKPEIKDGWGWERWDLKSWTRAGEGVYGGKAKVDDDGETETELEIVRDKYVFTISGNERCKWNMNADGILGSS